MIEDLLFTSATFFKWNPITNNIAQPTKQTNHGSVIEKSSTEKGGSVIVVDRGLRKKPHFFWEKTWPLFAPAHCLRAIVSRFEIFLCFPDDNNAFDLFFDNYYLAYLLISAGALFLAQR